MITVQETQQRYADAVRRAPKLEADVLINLGALMDELYSSSRVSKRLKKSLLDTLDLAGKEIADLRARSKPRLVKRRR